MGGKGALRGLAAFLLLLFSLLGVGKGREMERELRREKEMGRKEGERGGERETPGCLQGHQQAFPG